jgi:hypothetical protein
MTGSSNPQPSMFSHIDLNQFMPADYLMQKIWPLMRHRLHPHAVRADLCRGGPPIDSTRADVSGLLTVSLVLRWFEGLDLDAVPWDHSTFSQSAKRQFMESGLLDQRFDETVRG